MSFENPLDKIKQMNADNAAKKVAEAADIVEQEKVNQQDIDTEYNLAVEEKEVYSQQIIDIKNRISEISGTQEEMIAEYRKVIDEAKNNPETLQYVRDNFQEVFAAGINQWKEIGSDKLEVISSLEGAEESELDVENKVNELYPKTTERLFEIEKQVNEEFEFVDIDGTSVSLEKLEYTLSLGEKQKNLENMLNKFSGKYIAAEEEFKNLIQNSSERVESLIRSYGLHRLLEVTDLTPKLVKDYLEYRDIDKLTELVNSGLEEEIDKFKKLLKAIDDDRDIKTTTDVNNLQDTLNISFNWNNYSKIRGNKELMINSDLMKKINAYSDIDLSDVLKEAKLKKEERVKEILEKDKIKNA